VVNIPDKFLFRKQVFQNKIDGIINNGGGYIYESPDETFKSITDLSEEEIDSKIKQRFSNYVVDRIKNYQIEGLADHAMNNIIYLCKTHDIKMCFISLPPTDYFKKAIDKNKYSMYLNYIKKICVTRDIEFFDINLNSIPLTNKDFIDVDHMNKSGAETCSQYISGEILVNLLP